jgi:RNA polymerase sigma factor (sigma-70 family)
VALARVAQRWGRIDDPAAYVRRTLYTQSISRLRALRRRPPESLGATPAEPAWHADDLDLRVALDQALRKLTAHQRAVLMLRYHEDLSETQTAQVLGSAVGTVTMQLSFRAWPAAVVHLERLARVMRLSRPWLPVFAAPR